MATPRKRILVLASDEHLLIQLEHLLEDRGFETVTTWDSAEALELATHSRFELLLLGDHPPEVSAGEFLRELHCGAGSLPCLVLQSKAGAFSEQYLYALGASGVIDGGNCDEIVRRVQEWSCAPRSAAAV